MSFKIRMGISETLDLWTRLQREFRSGTISKEDGKLYKKWGKLLKLLSEDPKHRSLHTHDIEPLKRRYNERVWESYLENNADVLGIRARSAIHYGYRAGTSSGR